MVTVADAKWLRDRLKDAPEAKNQIAFADVIILNKTDLVSDDELREVEARIRAHQSLCEAASAERATCRWTMCSAATPSIWTASSRSSRSS